MTQRLGFVTVVVADYDTAIAYYTRQLGFELVEDTVAVFADLYGNRWDLIGPAAATPAGGGADGR